MLNFTISIHILLEQYPSLRRLFYFVLGFIA